MEGKTVKKQNKKKKKKNLKKLKCFCYGKVRTSRGIAMTSFLEEVGVIFWLLKLVWLRNQVTLGSYILEQLIMFVFLCIGSRK